VVGGTTQQLRAARNGRDEAATSSRGGDRARLAQGNLQLNRITNQETSSGPRGSRAELQTALAECRCGT
jgi:hypothetical protein